MKIQQYLPALIATTLVVGTSAPAWSTPIHRGQIKPLTKFGKSVVQFFQKKNDLGTSLTPKKTGLTLKEIGNQSLNNTLPSLPATSPPENIEDQSKTPSNIPKIASAAAVTTSGGAIVHHSWNKENNQKRQNRLFPTGKRALLTPRFR